MYKPKPISIQDIHKDPVYIYIYRIRTRGRRTSRENADSTALKKRHVKNGSCKTSTHVFSLQASGEESDPAHLSKRPRGRLVQNRPGNIPCQMASNVDLV